MERIKDNLAIIWFFLSTIAIAVLVYMFSKRGEKIATLVYEVQKTKLDGMMEKAKADLSNNEVDYEKALSRYNDLKRRYGISDTSPADKPSEPGNGAA